MRNQRRSILLSLGLFVVLLAAVIIQGRWFIPSLEDILPTPQPTATERPRAALDALAPVFTNLSELDLQEIRLSSPDGSQTLLIARMPDGQWAAPNVNGELENTAGSLIARTVSILPYLGTAQPPPEETNLADYGFTTNNPNAIILQLTLLDETTHRVMVGGRASGQEAFYAIVDNRPGFYLVDAGAIEFLRFQLANPPIRLTTE